MYKPFRLSPYIVSALVAAWSGLGCAPAKTSAPVPKASPVASEADKEKEETLSPVGTPGVNYPADYCANVFKIQPRGDIVQELTLVCKDNKPSDLMLSMRSQALKAEPGVINVRFLELKHTGATDRSEFLLAWSFHAPLRPYIVKARPLYDYIAKGHSSDFIDFKVGALRDNAEKMDSGLHLWNAKMNYDLAVKALPTLSLTNSRSTQYNLYQILSGNEEMGLGVETLVASPEEAYKVSNMVNISFNDGEGYNDGKGGTVVLNFLRFDFNNQGFPEAAEKAMMDIAKALADNMYKGLTAP